MANTLPHIEESNKTIYLPPKGDYETFIDDEHYAEKVREWGLSSTKEVKKNFWYKEAAFQRQVKIIGYEVYGKSTEYNTIVIEFEDGNLTCIHPAYLKEMQSTSFSKTISTEGEGKVSSSTPEEPKKMETKSNITTTSSKIAKEKKEKPQKIELPDEKVHFTAEVKQFALSWNHFNEENDEVIVLKDVQIIQDVPLEIGLSWCSHSKTLKKFELTPGDKLEFDGKVVKKKLPNGKEVEEEFIINEPVLYKINNPSKIKKSE